MIFVTGDCHGDFSRFATRMFPIQKELTRDDVVIVCGDFGIWLDSKTERYWLDWLSNKNFTVVFVDGNHENFDRLNSDEFQVVDFHGGKAHQIRDNIFHLMRGYVFEFEGKKFFAFGGASSHDIGDGILDRDAFDDEDEFQQCVNRWYKEGRMFRINHKTWWAEEMPSVEEMDFGLRQLEAHNYDVDYVITHCCPQEIASIMGFRQPDRLTNYFNTIAHSLSFDKWYFGHYHDERIIYSKFVLHYDEIERIL